MRVGTYRTKYVQLPESVKNLVPIDGSGTKEQQYNNLFPLSNGNVTVITRADNHGRLKRLYEPFVLEKGTDKDLLGRQFCIIIGMEWNPREYSKLTPENTVRIVLEIHNNRLKAISVQDFEKKEDVDPATLVPEELNRSIREFNFPAMDRQTRNELSHMKSADSLSNQPGTSRTEIMTTTQQTETNKRDSLEATTQRMRSMTGKEVSDRDLLDYVPTPNTSHNPDIARSARTRSLERPIRIEQPPKRNAISLEREQQQLHENLHLDPPVFPNQVQRDSTGMKKKTEETEALLKQQLVERDERLALSLLAEEETKVSNKRMERQLNDFTAKSQRDDQELRDLRQALVQARTETDRIRQESLRDKERNQDTTKQMVEAQEEIRKLRREVTEIKQEPNNNNNLESPNERRLEQQMEKAKREIQELKQELEQMAGATLVDSSNQQNKQNTRLAETTRTGTQNQTGNQTSQASPTLNNEARGTTNRLKPIGISNKINFPIYDKMRDDIEDIVDRFKKVLELFGGNDEDTKASLIFMFLQKNNMEELATYNPEILYDFGTLKNELIDRYQDHGNSDEIFVTTTIKNSEDERDFGDRLARIFRRWMKMDPSQPLTEGEEKTLKARYISALKDGKVRLRLRLEAENLSYQELAVRARQIRQAFQREEDGNGLVNTVLYLKQKVNELGEKVQDKQPRCEICRLPHPTEHCQASQKVARKHNKRANPPKSVEFAIPEEKLTPGVKPNDMLPTAEPIWQYEHNYGNNYRQNRYGQKPWEYDQPRPRYQRNRGPWRHNRGRWSNGWPSNYSNDFRPQRQNQNKETEPRDEQVHNGATLAARVEQKGENIFL